ncbi:hypothetical protein BGZ60DRAFT_199757 [Tricladium varicosporioides]|nr:hypothetical protein BGZ60DRAFT_199757 [Hymenoscyphus varicosporioides]
MFRKFPQRAAKAINIVFPILLFVLSITAIALIAQVLKIMKPLNNVKDSQYFHLSNDIVGLWLLNKTQIALAPTNWTMTSSHVTLVAGVLALVVGLVAGATGIMGQIDNREAAVMMMTGISTIGSFAALVASFVFVGKDPTNWFTYGVLEGRVNDWSEGKNLTSVTDYNAFESVVNTWVRGANVTVEGWSCLMKMQPFDEVDIRKFDTVCKDSRVARFLTIPLFLTSLIFFVFAILTWASCPSKRKEPASPIPSSNGSPAGQPPVSKIEGSV